jgi:NADPH:quinone reductase-like Zn-dependent oxidoreductase
MKGYYDSIVFKITYPSSPGWEGAGIVVKSGGGFFANRTLGKRVAFTRLVENNNEMNLGGCYQQYCLTMAMNVVSLPDSIPTEIGSMHFINPLSAIGLLERAQSLRPQTVI